MTVRSFVVALACVSSWLLGAGPAQGADPNVVPEVLMDLGAIQRRTGELEEAQANYEMAIEQIEDASGVYDTRLVAALSGLGAVLHDQGHFGEAVEVVDRAMYVSRMNAGLHNLNQVELLNQLTESLVALGEFQTASDKQAYSFTLLRRDYGLRNPAIIPATVFSVNALVMATTSDGISSYDVFRTKSTNFVATSLLIDPPVTNPWYGLSYPAS